MFRSSERQVRMRTLRIFALTWTETAVKRYRLSRRYGGGLRAVRHGWSDAWFFATFAVALSRRTPESWPMETGE